MAEDDHRLRRAAVEAEYVTGKHETTEQAARSHVLVRLARMTLGMIVIVIGIVMLPLPGPGALVIAAGLVILARDVAWADLALRYLRRKIPGVPEDGTIPRSTIVTGAVLALASVSLGLWFSFG